MLALAQAVHSAAVVERLQRQQHLESLRITLATVAWHARRVIHHDELVAQQAHNRHERPGESLAREGIAEQCGSQLLRAWVGRALAGVVLRREALGGAAVGVVLGPARQGPASTPVTPRVAQLQPVAIDGAHESDGLRCGGHEGAVAGVGFRGGGEHAHVHDDPC